MPSRIRSCAKLSSKQSRGPGYFFCLHRGCSLGRFATLARTDLWDMPRAMKEARFNRKRHVSRAHFFAPFNSLRA